MLPPISTSRFCPSMSLASPRLRSHASTLITKVSPARTLSYLSSHSLRSSDGNDSRGFDGRRLGLVGDQLAQERNQHDEHDTDRETAGAELREELRVPGVGGDRRGAGRLRDHSRKVACKE